VVLAVGGSFKVGSGIPDYSGRESGGYGQVAALQELEEALAALAKYV
jgi:hypothetical protein